MRWGMNGKITDDAAGWYSWPLAGPTSQHVRLRGREGVCVGGGELRGQLTHLLCPRLNCSPSPSLHSLTNTPRPQAAPLLLDPASHPSPPLPPPPSRRGFRYTSWRLVGYLPAVECFKGLHFRLPLALLLTFTEEKTTVEPRGYL